MKASVLAGALPRLPLAKGARIPSTAEEVCAEMRKAAFRAEADLRWGLDCLRAIRRMVRQCRAIGNDELKYSHSKLRNYCNGARAGLLDAQTLQDATSGEAKWY